VFGFIHQQITWHCSLFVAEQRPWSNRSISPGCRAYSSKSATAACWLIGQMNRQRDRQTFSSFTDPATHTMRAVWKTTRANQPTSLHWALYEQLYDCRHCNGLSYNYNASHVDKNTQCYLLLAVSQHLYNGTVSVHLSVPSINSSSDVQHAIQPIWHLILSHQTVFLATMVEVFFSLHLGRQPSAS